MPYTQSLFYMAGEEDKEQGDKEQGNNEDGDKKEDKDAGKISLAERTSSAELSAGKQKSLDLFGTNTT